MTLKVTQRQDGTLAIAGRIDEAAAVALGAIASARGVALDCSAVESMNSAGARVWCTLMDRLSVDGPVELRDCSVSFIDCMNLFTQLVESCDVTSFFCPYRCTSCQHDAEVRYETSSVSEAEEPTPPRCTRCGGATSTHIPWGEYLSFLQS